MIGISFQALPQVFSLFTHAAMFWYISIMCPFTHGTVMNTWAQGQYGARILSHSLSSFQPFLEWRRLFANKSGLIDVVIQSYENKWCVEKNRDHHHQYSDHHHQYSVVMVMLARDRPPHQTDVTLYIRPSPGNVTAVRLCSG